MNIDVASGVRLRVLDWGGPDPAVVLLHPNGFCAGLYEPLADRLRQVARPIAIDLRGHGASTAPTGANSYAFDQLAADVVAVLDVLGLHGVAGVGGSLGGAVAVLVDRLDPGRWSRLLLAEPVAFPIFDESAPAGADNPMAAGARRRRDRFPDRAAVVHAYRDRPPLSQLAPEALEAYVRWGTVEDGDGVRLACRPEVEATVFEVSTGPDGAAAAWEHLPHLCAPTTIVAGEQTFLPDIFAEQAARADAELVTVPGGHFVLHEDTARGVALIERYGLRERASGRFGHVEAPPMVPAMAATHPPAWFTSAIATDARTTHIDVDGCAIHVLSWGDTAKPGLVLVHGGAAHARWWSFIAPQLTHHYHVAALDLSGHGDSGHRERYDMEQWAREVLGVAGALGMDRPITVGHSMGGFVTMVTAALHGDDVAGTIIIDSPVRRPDPETEEANRGRAFSNPKTYPSLEEAMEHFHLVPPQPCENRYIVDHIARHSLRETPAGWTWKFDRGVFDRFAAHELHEYLAMVKTRVAVLHGQFSAIVTPEVTDHMFEVLGRNAPFVEIPQAHHHVPLDQPLALIAALRALLADWEHSVPMRG